MENRILLTGKGCHTSGCTVGDFEMWNINQFYLAGFAPLRKLSVWWRILLSNSLGHFKNESYVTITMTVLAVDVFRLSAANVLFNLCFQLWMWRLSLCTDWIIKSADSVRLVAWLLTKINAYENVFKKLF